MESGVTIRPAMLRDAGAFADYVVVHVTESGKDGAPVFSPAGRPSREEMRDNAKVRWARRLNEPQWGRAWLLEIEGTPGVVGHIELRGGRILSEMHRATLGMGMLQVFTRRGHGRRLLDTAIAWAREETAIAWIDLGVFGGNEPARKLYERAGFQREFLRRDAFRNDDGSSIDDVLMTLALR